MNIRSRRIQRLSSMVLMLILLVSLAQGAFVAQAQPLEAQVASTLIDSPQPNASVGASTKTSAAAPSTPMTATTTLIDRVVETDQPAHVQPTAQPLVPPAAQPAASAPALPADIHVDTSKLAIAVSPQIRPGDVVSYTYIYTNTTGAPLENLVLRTTWSDFNYTETTGKVLFCALPATECGFIPESVVGPQVTFIQRSSGTGGIGLEFSIGSLAPNQRGSFVVRLNASLKTIPLAERDPLRPAGSAVLTEGGQNAVQATNSSTLMGPLFIIEKTAAPNLKIFPLETGTFTITLKNMSRIDAINATNTVLTDVVPIASEYVAATGNPDVSSSAVTWNVGSLPIGASVQYTVTYRRLDVYPSNRNCLSMDNKTYYVTSAEMPVVNSSRTAIYGKTATIGVVLPLTLMPAAYSPNNIIYGQYTTVTLKVRSNWEQPLTGVRLEYDIQDNASYVSGSAIPALSTDPSPPNGTAVWTFDMPAASRTEYQERIFTLRLQAGYQSDLVGSAHLVVPSPVPAACSSVPVEVKVNLKPRLVVSLTSPATDQMISTGVYSVRRGDSFPMTIMINNLAPIDAALDRVWLNFPTESDANFSYVAGSAVVAGAAREPDTVVNGSAGKIEWVGGIVVPANGTVIITFNILVDAGRDYINYCFYALAEKDPESIDVSGSKNRLCLKINPNITMTKTADVASAGPNDMVEFTLTLTNNELTDYIAGIVDYLPTRMVYDHTVSGYSLTPTVTGSRVYWPVVNVSPGETIQVVFVARISTTACVPADLFNEAVFDVDQGTIIHFVPPVGATVSLVCDNAFVRYRLDPERPVVGLRDQFFYRISLQNLDDTLSSGTMAVTMILPLDFEYVGIAPGSPIQTAPTQAVEPGGAVRLNWLLDSVAPDTTAQVLVLVRSSQTVVSNIQALMYATGVAATTDCIGTCLMQEYNGQTINMAAPKINVAALITSEPVLDNTACAVPGDRRTYRVTLYNTNVHNYPQTDVTVRLPIGLKYIGTTGRRVPMALPQADGSTLLRWYNLDVPAETGGNAGQIFMEAQIEVGNTWANLQTAVDATTPYGIIPRKEGVEEPTIRLCPTSPSLSKAVASPIGEVGDDMIYQIVIANPNFETITASVRDVLPANMSFVSMVQGDQPTISGGTLTWNVTVPARVDPPTGSPIYGSVVLIFKARIDSADTAFTTYTNTAEITQSSVAIDIQHAAATYTIPIKSYIPLLPYTPIQP